MLTDAAVNASGATEQPRKLFDERGLFLLINPNGSRLWRLKYRIENREKLLAATSPGKRAIRRSARSLQEHCPCAVGERRCGGGNQT